MKKLDKSTGWIGLLVFALLSLALLHVLLTAAGVYQDLADRGEAQNHSRTAAQYIATRVRQSQAVTLEDFEGHTALISKETIDDETYITRVYLHGGYLRELFSRPGAPLSPEDGEKLVPLDTLDFSLKDGLLTVQVQGRCLMLRIPVGQEVPQ